MLFLNSSCDIPVVVRRQAPMAQTVLGSPAVAVHRQDRRNPCPDAEADPSGSNDSGFIPLWQYTDREVGVLAWQDRASPTGVICMEDNSKTVETPQAQFMETNPYAETVPPFQEIQMTVEIPQVQSMPSHHTNGG